jgi:hypothetical protein
VNGGFRNQIVVRGKDRAAIDAALAAVNAAIARLRPDDIPA